MTLDELAGALFPSVHDLTTDAAGVTAGTARTRAGTELGVAGIIGGHPLGIDAAITLSRHVLAHVAAHAPRPLVILVDTQSQLMSRRDELLGLNEYLAHLTKGLALASLTGCRTVGILYGAAAAGAFIATALSTDRLVSLPGAAPSVMDLPSIARVTKLPLDRLQELAAKTPIFAPGLDALFATGAVHETWEDDYAQRLDRLLSADRTNTDDRDRLGAERQGRLRAMHVAAEVEARGVAP